VLAAVFVAAALSVIGPPVSAGFDPEAANPHCSAAQWSRSCPIASANDTVPPVFLMPNSLFDRNVTKWPVDRNSKELVAEFNFDWQQNYGNVGVNGRPVIWVPASQRMVPLSASAGCSSNFLDNTGKSAPVPRWAGTSGHPDSALTVYQPSSNTVWELYQAQPVTTGGAAGNTGGSGGWSACWGGKARLSTFTGVFPQPYGETATGISNLATEVTEADVLLGSIRHTIGLQVANCTMNIYPADRGDCGFYPGNPAEGQWFRFPASVDCAAYDTTPFENEVCIAGQRYVFVIVDQGGSDGIIADYATGTWAHEGNPGPAGSWEDNAKGACCVYVGGGGPLEDAFQTASGYWEQEYQVIASLPWSRLQVIDPPQSKGAATSPAEP
jgi:hypothetical protein